MSQNKFAVVFTNGVEDKAVYFNVRDTPIAFKWFNQLKRNYEIREKNRVVGFGRTVQDVVHELNKQVDVINLYDPKINLKLSRSCTQDELNYAHEYFEKLRGPIHQPTAWFNKAPTAVKKALEIYNITIHLTEQIQRKGRSTVVTFVNPPRYKLTAEDTKYFIRNVWAQPGTVFIDYCHVGKSMISLFNDNDTTTVPTPQTHYSADFAINFKSDKPPILYDMIKRYRFERWIKKHNFEKYAYNLGMIPVADIEAKINVSDMYGFNTVKAVSCI